MNGILSNWGIDISARRPPDPLGPCGESPEVLDVELKHWMDVANILVAPGITDRVCTNSFALSWECGGRYGRRLNSLRLVEISDRSLIAPKAKRWSAHARIEAMEPYSGETAS